MDSVCCNAGRRTEQHLRFARKTSNLGSRPPEVYLLRETNPLPSRPRAAAVTSKIFLAVAIIVIGAILVAGGAMVVAATARPPSRASSAGSAVAADVVTLLATNADGCHYWSEELCGFVALGLPRI
jgi:hypothetical protein